MGASCGWAFAQTAEELVADGKNTENVLTFGMGYDLKMWSPLRQINKSNVKRLVPIWKTAWKIPLQDLASSAGMLGTDGGLLFTGKLTGEFIALDQDTGKQLWQFKTGSSVNAPPITYTHKGIQYVTILSGRGGSNPTRSAGDIIPAGGSVVTFALLPE